MYISSGLVIFFSRLITSLLFDAEQLYKKQTIEKNIKMFFNMLIYIYTSMFKFE